MGLRVCDHALAGSVVLFWPHRQSVEELGEEELPTIVLAGVHAMLLYAIP
jgi:hypothetical protein